jgi:putative SOS response-associated peptidase YedK
MCGRYEVHTPVEEIARRFEAGLTPAVAALQPRYDVAPSLAVPVVREGRNGRVLEAMTWGLVPSWSGDATGAKPINARAETVFDQPMFRNAIRRRRCLIPADGFYEWQAGALRKQPYHVGLVDGGLFAFAGIWEYWARAGQEPRVSCAIIVTQANELVARIHERMPVIIAPEDYARWLDPVCADQAAIGPMLTPFPAELMRAYAVGTRVNSAANDDAQLLEPVHS